MAKEAKRREGGRKGKGEVWKWRVHSGLWLTNDMDKD